MTPIFLKIFKKRPSLKISGNGIFCENASDHKNDVQGYGYIYGCRPKMSP